ncbi:uncharacterized protein I303_104236 [Kwoniella dejecticola CBS 10117]|uniref:Uncharacterized protein n=1 Tax=Kwoniella dejecticola CBS 10117 TaxID=1296121 RepID=A0A1A6A5W7_9TREE|nr:uncharacterized protein I303_04787 [Kwoniella dejecticola CBS 10117]OBR85451.1 hypothetical protein I303_04787 [Kwoniella dejecticola CBS 10117]
MSLISKQLKPRSRASGIELAEEVVEGDGYRLAKLAMTAAQDTSSAAQSTSDILISAAEEGIDAAEAEVKVLIDGATEALRKIEQTSTEFVESEAAKEAWNKAVESAAEKTEELDTLSKDVGTGSEDQALEHAQVALDAVQAAADSALVAAFKAVGTAGRFGDTLLGASQRGRIMPSYSTLHISSVRH